MLLWPVTSGQAIKNSLSEQEEPCEWESPIPRRGPAAASRAKSFRDRLDPLLGKYDRYNTTTTALALRPDVDPGLQLKEAPVISGFLHIWRSFWTWLLH